MYGAAVAAVTCTPMSSQVAQRLVTKHLCDKARVPQKPESIPCLSPAQSPERATDSRGWRRKRKIRSFESITPSTHHSLTGCRVRPRSRRTTARLHPRLVASFLALRTTIRALRQGAILKNIEQPRSDFGTSHVPDIIRKRKVPQHQTPTAGRASSGEGAWMQTQAAAAAAAPAAAACPRNV